jgi:MFS family permease
MSIFGNMILSWALPFYILDISNSAAIFGLVLSVPYISLIIMSPIGGIMADRLKKQRIMFWLDLSTTSIIILYMFASGLIAAAVPLVIVKLLALNAIQGMYMPVVQAAVPALVPSDKLIPANSTVTIINSLSNLLAPAAAGILYGRFGLFPILVISVLCFSITALMDLLINIPFKKQASPGNVIQLIKSDMSQAVKFAIKEKPVLVKCVIVAFVFSITIASMIIVGIPVLITKNLGMEMGMVGISSSVMMFGGLLGGILAGVLGARLTMQKIYLPLLFCCISLLPMGIIFFFNASDYLVYVVITVSSALALISTQVCNIQFFAFIQKETPSELIGKVMSILLIVPFLANALGQLLFGMLFEQFGELPWIIIFLAIFFSGIVVIYSRIWFKNVIIFEKINE